MANTAELGIYVRAKDDASRVLGDIEKKAGGLGKAFGDMTKIAGGFVMAQGVMAAPGFLMDAAQAAADDAASCAKLQKAVENSGAAWDSYKGTLDTVIKTAQKRGFTDDQARDALALLTAQTGDAGEAAKRFAMAQDLARGANIDVYTASKLLGKVTDENVNVLARYGIKVAEGASEAELFGAIQQKFGGQAEAFANSTAGQMEAAKIQMQELKESIGYALLPIMTKLVGVLTEDIIPAIQKLVAEWGPKLQDAFGAVKGVIEPVIDALKGPLQDALTFLDEHKEILVAFAATVAILLVPALWAWTAAEIAKTAAMLAAAAAFVLANAPIIAVAAAIGLLVVGIIELVKHWDDIWPKIKAVWDTVLGFFTGTVGPFFTVTVPGFFISLKDKVVGVVTDIMGWLEEHWQTIVTVALAVLFPPGAGLFWIVTHFEEVKDAVLGFIGNIVEAITGLPGTVAGLVGSWFGASLGLGDAMFRGLMEGLKQAPGMVEAFLSGIWEALKGLINQAIDAVNNAIPNSIGAFGIGIDLPDNPIPHLATGIRNFRGGLALVGERGPELAYIPRGADVYSAQESRTAGAGRWTNYGRVTFNFPRADSREAAREIARQLRGL